MISKKYIFLHTELINGEEKKAFEFVILKKIDILNLCFMVLCCL